MKASKTNMGVLMLACAAGLICMPAVRWNIALFMYMPMLSGTGWKFEALQPLYDAFVEWELSLNSSLLTKEWAVREIQAKDYSYEYLMKVSENSRYPVVIRGLMDG